MLSSLITEVAHMRSAPALPPCVEPAAQDEPPLPQSLTALRVDTRHVTTLSELRRWDRRRTAGTAPVLTVRAQ